MSRFSVFVLPGASQQPQRPFLENQVPLSHHHNHHASDDCASDDHAEDDHAEDDYAEDDHSEDYHAEDDHASDDCACVGLWSYSAGGTGSRQSRFRLGFDV